MGWLTFKKFKEAYIIDKVAIIVRFLVILSVGLLLSVILYKGDAGIVRSLIPLVIFSILALVDYLKL